MTDNLATDLDTRYHQDPATLDSARRVVQNSGRTDVDELLEMLGLVEAKPRERAVCPACQRPYCPGRRDCRTRSCELGPAGRKAKR